MMIHTADINSLGLRHCCCCRRCSNWKFILFRFALMGFGNLCSNVYIAFF